jgi:hypothetical protein
VVGAFLGANSTEGSVREVGVASRRLGRLGNVLTCVDDIGTLRRL